jgi:hypothetical protein
MGGWRMGRAFVKPSVIPRSIGKASTLNVPNRPRQIIRLYFPAHNWTDRPSLPLAQLSAQLHPHPRFRFHVPQFPGLATNHNHKRAMKYGAGSRLIPYPLQCGVHLTGEGLGPAPFPFRARQDLRRSRGHPQSSFRTEGGMPSGCVQGGLGDRGDFGNKILASVIQPADPCRMQRLSDQSSPLPLVCNKGGAIN